MSRWAGRRAQRRRMIHAMVGRRINHLISRSSAYSGGQCIHRMRQRLASATIEHVGITRRIRRSRCYNSRLRQDDPIVCKRLTRYQATVLLSSGMHFLRLAAPFLALMAASLSFAADVVAPDSNLKAEGIPPIPAALVAKVAPYTEFKPATIVSWHPERRELIVARRAGNVTQLHRVAAPGNEPEQLTAFSEPVRFGAYLAQQPGVLVFARHTGGN